MLSFDGAQDVRAPKTTPERGLLPNGEPCSHASGKVFVK